MHGIHLVSLSASKIQQKRRNEMERKETESNCEKPQDRTLFRMHISLEFLLLHGILALLLSQKEANRKVLYGIDTDDKRIM